MKNITLSLIADCLLFVIILAELIVYLVSGKQGLDYGLLCFSALALGFSAILKNTTIQNHEQNERTN